MNQYVLTATFVISLWMTPGISLGQKELKTYYDVEQKQLKE